jgi:hypothetical protein
MLLPNARRKFWADRLHNHAIAGGLPTGFTSRWDTPAAFAVQAESVDGPPSNKEILFDISAGGQYCATLDAAGQLADVDIVVLVKPGTPTGTQTLGGAACRISGSAGSANCYAFSFGGTSSNPDIIRLRKIVANTTTSLNSPAITWTPNTWYWVRLRTIGNAIKGKYWQLGSAEPAAWTAEATDSDITAAGYAGLYSSNAVDPSFGYIAVAPGSPAPTF